MIDISLFMLGYNILKATGSPRSIYNKKVHKNILKQDLIASKIYNN